MTVLVDNVISVELFKQIIGRETPIYVDAITKAESIYGKLVKVEGDIHTLSCSNKTTLVNFQLTFQKVESDPPPMGADW